MENKVIMTGDDDDDRGCEADKNKLRNREFKTHGGGFLYGRRMKGWSVSRDSHDGLQDGQCGIS